MEESSRRRFLLKAQNPDGGWGYFPGKTSWLEPTGWAALALHGDPAADRAYKLVKGWQRPDGSARPCAHVDSPHWTAALIVTLAALRHDIPVLERGVRYLMETVGAESGPLMRVLHFLDPQRSDREPKFEGWPWRQGAAAWIEPTVHSITALRLAKPILAPADPRIDARIVSAQNLIWHQRCRRERGWNYGARVAREVSLDPFPETTALALVGLISSRPMRESIETAQRLGAKSNSPLTHAWLSLGLQLHGIEHGEPDGPAVQDVLVSAIAELGSPRGNWRILAERK